MNDPSQYIISNKVQRLESENALNKYLHLVQWKPDGGDVIMDIGCGTGDVTWDILKPKLPKTFEKLVGADISQEMIKFARSRYIHPQIEFTVLDIGASEMPDNYKTKFDHIFSFYCLHWVQDQRKALQNIFDLLKPGGEMLVLIVAKCSYFNIYEVMAEMDKWSPFLFDAHKYISPYQHVNNIEILVADMLRDVGFELDVCNIQDKITKCVNLNELRNYLVSVNPFMYRMSPATKEDYLKEVLKQFEKMNLFERKNNQQVFISIPYELMTIFARKPVR